MNGTIPMTNSEQTPDVVGYDSRIIDLAAIAAKAAGKNANVAPQLLLADITFTLADAVEDGRISLGQRSEGDVERDPICANCGCFKSAHEDDEGELICPRPATRFQPATLSPCSRCRELEEAASHLADEMDGLLPYLASHSWRLDRLHDAVAKVRALLTKQGDQSDA